MESRIWKHVYLSPWIRLNFYTGGFTLSFGLAKPKLRLDNFLQAGRQAKRWIRLPDVYFSESRRWTNPRATEVAPQIFEA
jgi:hypothetical protein